MRYGNNVVSTKTSGHVAAIWKLFSAPLEINEGGKPTRIHQKDEFLMSPEAPASPEVPDLLLWTQHGAGRGSEGGSAWEEPTPQNGRLPQLQ